MKTCREFGLSFLKSNQHRCESDKYLFSFLHYLYLSLNHIFVVPCVCLSSRLQALSRVIPRDNTSWRGCWMLSNRWVSLSVYLSLESHIWPHLVLQPDWKEKGEGSVYRFCIVSPFAFNQCCSLEVNMQRKQHFHFHKLISESTWFRNSSTFIAWSVGIVTYFFGMWKWMIT